jgi:PAS domain S-box-containing protein
MDADLPFSGDFTQPGHCVRILDALAPIRLWAGDSQGRIHPVHPAFLEIAGMSLEASADPGWVAELDPAERDATGAEWLRCLENSLPWEREFRVHCREGRLRHVLSRGTPALGRDGRSRAWVGINLDVTGIREAGDEARRFRERVLLALSNGGDYLYEIDLGTGGRRWFGPVEDLVGCGRDGFPGTQAAWDGAVHEVDRQALAEACLGGGPGPFRLEYRLCRLDGGRRRLLDRGRRIPGADGHPGYVIGIVTDISGTQCAADEARRGEERRRAGQRLEVIGRLAGGIAHDFNNLLTAINGFSELLANSLEDGSQRAYALEIQKAGERAALITRQLLAFSRKQILAPRVVDLNALASDVARALPGLLGADMEVIVRPDPQGAHVKADPAQVEQVFLNLASNAREAMPGGGRLLFEIGRAESDPGEEEPDEDASPGPYVVITVQDEGEGLDEEAQAHLFEPFFAARGRAQGLGLPAVYGIVKQNGGHIVACSRKGEGTIFRIHWPRWSGEAGEPRPTAAQSQPASGEASDAPDRHPLVLVAEDDEGTRDLVRHILEGEGFGVLAAASGQEALDLLRDAHRPPDLLLADVIMPGMGGVELAGRLRPARPDLKVLFMSGFADHQIVRQGVVETGQAFIGKPFAPGALLAKIQEVLAIRQAA